MMRHIWLDNPFFLHPPFPPWIVLAFSLTLFLALIASVTYDPISLLALHFIFSDLIPVLVDLIDCKQDLLQRRLSLPSCDLVRSIGSCALASSEHRGSYANDSANGWLC